QKTENSSRLDHPAARRFAQQSYFHTRSQRSELDPESSKNLFSVFCSLTTDLLRRPGGHCEGQYTRSHPELGRENPQRRWYSVLRRGRVGHRQVFQAESQRTVIREQIAVFALNHLASDPYAIH